MNANTATFADAAVATPTTSALLTSAVALATQPILRVRLPLTTSLWRYLRPTEHRYPLVLLA